MKCKLHAKLCILFGLFLLLLIINGRWTLHLNGISRNIGNGNKANVHSSPRTYEEDPLPGKNEQNDWTIILTLNGGYFDFFLNWFEAYTRLELRRPVVVVAEDRAVYEKLRKLGLAGTTTLVSEFEQINETVSFGSHLFNDLSIRRHTYILKYLLLGTNVIFSDTDTVWIENPLPYFTGSYDMWMQIDTPTEYCPGTMAVVSNENTINFFRNLTHRLARKPQADQPLLNRILSKSHLRVKGLDRRKFPSGRTFFEKFGKKERSDVVVVHNNWIEGHKEKLNRFKLYNLWFANQSA